MKKAELAKHIPKRIGQTSMQLLEVCGEPVLMTTGTRDPSYAGMPNKAAHFTWSTGYLTAWIDGSRVTWTNEGLAGCSISTKMKNEDYKAQQEFLDAVGFVRYCTSYDVSNYETQINWRRRERAAERKQDRINRFMEQNVPPLPDGFEDRIREMAKDVKPGKKMNVKTFQQTHDVVVERMFTYMKGPGQIGSDYYGVQLMEGSEVLTELCRAFTSTYGDKWDFWYYGECCGEYGRNQRFWDRRQMGQSKLPKRYRIYDNFNDEDMTRQQESCLRIMDGLVDPSILLNRLHFCPSLEYVIKAGWTRMAADLCEWSTGKCGEKLDELSRLDKNARNRLAGLNVSMAAEELWEKSPKLSDANLKEISKWKTSDKISYLEEIGDMGLNMNHVLTLLRKTQGIKRETLMFYRDYLQMAQARGDDIHDEIIYRNKRWRDFHDRYAADQKKAEMKAKADKFKGIERDFDRNVRIFGWNNGTSCILIPKTYEDIIEEGQRQHHCVGASDHYMLNMATRKTWIVFLRHMENPEEPWYTIETDGARVIQFYAAYDRQPGKEEVEKILEEWMKDVRKNKAKVEGEAHKMLVEALENAPFLATA